MKPIAFVIPWYGDGIRGGAENECNHLAHCLIDSGLAVEVLTTCVRQAADDRSVNTLPEGVSIESGVTVRRFKARRRDEEEFHRVNYLFYNNLAASREDEEVYFKEDITSPAMYRYISENKDNYRCFIFLPYLYGPIYNGSMQCPGSYLMIPCLHNEGYARMRLVKEMMESSKGMIFLSRMESELAHKLYDLSQVKTAVLGAYVESDWVERCDANAFREKFGIHDDFILYAGRKEAGKKADELIMFFMEYKRRRPGCALKLVLIGGGDLALPEDSQGEIFDLGFVSVDDKYNAMSASLFLCNPSRFESFSIVIMESWLARRPVLVSEDCAVTADFCLQTNGGLYYRGFPEFCGCVDYFLSHGETANQMGENGRRYVMDHFVHDVIAKKYIDFLVEVLE